MDILEYTLQFHHAEVKCYWKDCCLNLLLISSLLVFNCARNITNKFVNLLSPDRNNETEESKCCKQLGSEALTLKIFSEIIVRMVSLGFDSDWKVKTKT